MSLESDPAQLDQSDAPHSAVPDTQWHRFTKATVLGDALKLVGFLGLAVFYGAKQILENDGIDELRDSVSGISSFILIILAAVAAFVLIVTVFSAITWRFKRFALVPDGIHLQSGVFIKQHVHVRWDRVQSVDISQNLVARVLNQGSVAVESGAAGTDDVELGLLTMKHCEALRQVIMEASAAARLGKDPEFGDWTKGSAVTAQEFPIYALETRRLVLTTLYSVSGIAGIFSLAGTLLVGLVLDGFAWIPFLFVVLGSAWSSIKKLAKTWGTKVFLASNGVRIRSGLVSTFAQTVAPGRVHAIEINQPRMWRRLGWWRLSVLTLATGEVNDDADALVIPVGTREEVERMLWVILPDLGVDDAQAFLEEAFAGSGGSVAFTPAPEQSKWLDPVGWRSNAIALTRTVAVLRWSGFWRRSTKFVLHDHYQSLALSQGPLERRLELASLRFCMVNVAVIPIQSHLRLDDAVRLIGNESVAGKVRRAAADRESIEAWRLRVGVH